MKNILNKFLSINEKFNLIIKSLKEIYKYGGYSTFNISYINYGDILKGKKVLITGGGSGIGLSIAKKCLKVGAEVVITGRTENKLKDVCDEINNPLLKMIVWDMSQISRLIQNIEKTKVLLGGDVDILVNNAGILNHEDFPNVTEKNWDETYEINSKGLFFLTQSLCKQWMNIENKQLKKVINISSQGGFVGATYPYRMTKWDVAGLTQGLGIKLAELGIIVNGIAPGIIATSMVSNYLDQKENIYCKHNPLKRFALPEEIAELAIFLMSDASNFIVGQTIICDGGFSIK